MSDYLANHFRAQLTSTMKATLRKAVCDIIVIFEESLHGHQMELVQKGEEVAHLKVKLQAAELKLKEHEIAKGAVEKSTTDITDANKMPEDAVEPPGQATDVPKIDFEVPEDWCCPVGDETLLKQDEGVCPSVRLQKESSQASDFSEKTGCVRMSTTDSAKNERDVTKNKTLPNRGKRKRCNRGDITNLLIDLERFNQMGRVFGRTRHRNLTEEQQRNQVKRRKKGDNLLVTKSPEKKGGKEGRKKKFPSRSIPVACEAKGTKMQRRLAKKAERTSSRKREPRRVSNSASQPRKELILKKGRQHCKSSHHKNEMNGNLTWTVPVEDIESHEVGASWYVSGVNYKTMADSCSTGHICSICQKVCKTRFLMVEHLRIHTGEKPVKCQMCQETFRTVQQRYRHVQKWHADKKKRQCKKCKKILRSIRKRDEHEPMCCRK